MLGHSRGYHPHLVRGEIIATDDTTSDGEQALALYGLDGEILYQVYRPQAYGLTSHARPGAHGLLMSLGGERNESYLIGGEDPDKRPRNLAEGEVKLYDDSGNIIYMGLKNGITLSAAGGDAVIKTANGAVRLSSSGHVFATPAAGNNVYLGMGAPGGSAVMTTAGPSRNVFAQV